MSWDTTAGLDYVSHDDVLPYMASGQEPFKHELFSQFLQKLDSTEEGGSLPLPSLLFIAVFSGTSDKGPSEIGTTSLQRTLVAAPC